MPTRRLATLALAWSALLGASAAAPDDPPEIDPGFLGGPEGEWECGYSNYDGRTSDYRESPSADKPWFRPIFAADAWSWRPAPGDPPRRFARVAAGPEPGRSIELIDEATGGRVAGIYEVRGDLLRICLSTDRPGSPPPDDFEVRPGEHRALLIFRRVAGDRDARRQSEIACLSAASLAELRFANALAKLGQGAPAGPPAPAALETGAARPDSALLSSLREALGVEPSTVRVTNLGMIALSLFHIGKARPLGERRQRLSGESVAEIREALRRRQAERANPDPKP